MQHHTEEVMPISADTWAVVAATGLGPLAAVALTLWREAAGSKYGRRLHVFRTLMATRKIAISSNHVNALNLVEVDFYKCRKIEEAWKEYKNHLMYNGLEDDSWLDKKERLFAQLLFEMAVKLGLNIPAMEIFRGGYAPKGWQHRDNRNVMAMEYLHNLSMGQAALPIFVMNPAPQSAAVPPSQPRVPEESKV
jgi:hypothetical protein